MKNSFVDTNILIDLLVARVPFSKFEDLDFIIIRDFKDAGITVLPPDEVFGYL